MKRNTKYVAKDGYQIAMYPNEVMNITQSINGSFSHRGANAIDDAQKDTGISPGFAPCDMRCVATDYKPGNGNAIWWESVNKVHTLKYGLTKIYMMVIHDNTANAYVGMIVKQGDQLYDEGTAGYRVTGPHNHIEIGIGNFKGMYVLNNHGVWMMPGNVDPSDVLFADDTKIINGGGLIWEKIPASLKKGTSKPSIKLIPEHRIAVVGKGHNINIRKDSPTGAIVRVAKEGTRIEYTEKVTEGFDHRYVSWLENGTRLFMACSADQTQNNMWISVEPLPTKRTKQTGIDISAHQTNMNYSEMAKDVDFAILRASYGEIEDTMLKTHLNGLQQAGVPVVGLYCFDYALDDNQARAEAQTIVALAKKFNLPKSTVLWFDCEYDSVDYAASPNRNQIGAIHKDAKMVQRHTRIFMDEVKKAGYKTGFYANLDWMKRYYNNFNKKEDELFWYARYDHDPEYDYDVLQYTPDGKIRGYNGRVDMNIRYAGTAAKPEPKPQSKPESKPQPVKWDQNAVLKVGDTVKSVSCPIAVYPGRNSAIVGDCVYIPSLGGLVPLKDVSEAADTRDGKKDDVLANTNSRVYLTETKVTAINNHLNTVMVNGYWVNAEPLMAKR